VRGESAAVEQAMREMRAEIAQRGFPMRDAPG
jgi:hypothetical protein